MTSMLRGWVEELPLREQGTLLTGLRGCDLAPKNPVDSVERQLTAYLRWVTCNPFDEREVGAVKGAFMQTAPPENWKLSALEHYPLHWVIHVMHAYEVVGYRHPEPLEREKSLEVYLKMVKELHLESEPRLVMIDRLSEDRVATGNIVS